MKKILLISLLFAGLKAKSQTLEHTYSGLAYFTKVADNEWCYNTFENATKTVRIYDTSHNLIKTIVLNTTDVIYSVSSVTRTLFNTDNQFELIASSSAAPFAVKIYNESGNVIFQKQTVSAASGWPVNTSTGAKLIINEYVTVGSVLEYTTYVYSLAGTVPGMTQINEGELESTKSLAYPNPTNDLILIPSSANSTIEVYNTTGVLIDKYISNGYSTYNAAKLPSGMYIYKIDGTESGNFIKQ